MAGGSAPLFGFGRALSVMPPDARPICNRMLEPQWCAREGRYKVTVGNSWGTREDLEECPRGVVLVEETQYFHVAVPIPFCRCDQS